MAGVDEGSAWRGTAFQADAGAGEGGLAKSLGPEQAAGLRVSEAWLEPLNVGSSGSKPEPGQGRLFGFEEERRPGGQIPGAVAG